MKDPTLPTVPKKTIRVKSKATTSSTLEAPPNNLSSSSNSSYNKIVNIDLELVQQLQSLINSSAHDKIEDSLQTIAPSKATETLLAALATVNNKAIQYTSATHNLFAQYGIKQGPYSKSFYKIIPTASSAASASASATASATSAGPSSSSLSSSSDDTNSANVSFTIAITNAIEAQESASLIHIITTHPSGLDTLFNPRSSYQPNKTDHIVLRLAMECGTPELVQKLCFNQKLKSIIHSPQSCAQAWYAMYIAWKNNELTLNAMNLLSYAKYLQALILHNQDAQKLIEQIANTECQHDPKIAEFYYLYFSPSTYHTLYNAIKENNQHSFNLILQNSYTGDLKDNILLLSALMKYANQEMFQLVWNCEHVKDIFHSILSYGHAVYTLYTAEYTTQEAQWKGNILKHKELLVKTISIGSLKNTIQPTIEQYAVQYKVHDLKQYYDNLFHTLNTAHTINKPTNNSSSASSSASANTKTSSPIYTHFNGFQYVFPDNSNASDNTEPNSATYIDPNGFSYNQSSVLSLSVLGSSAAVSNVDHPD